MHKEIPKIRAPKGFRFWIVKINDNFVKVALRLKDGREIGRVNLVKAKPGSFSTHSFLDSSFHMKGLGALMYARAIQYALEKRWKVTSSGRSSEYAQRVWRGRTIRKFFSIKIKKGSDPAYDKWYAYAK